VLTFHVMSGKHVRDIIETSRLEIFERVRETYLAHHRGETINPDSYFLRFPEKPDARIIALPAMLRGAPGVAGMKWIASFPGNVARNIPRASATLVLNDFATGYPFVCMEAAQISAARTAASAALGAEQLHGSRTAGRIAVIGAGVISRNILEFLRALGWVVGDITIHDAVPAYAGKAVRHAESLGYSASVSDTLAEAVDGADLIILATTAAEPYIVDAGALGPGHTVLNISLRDIGPDIIARSHNVVDDVEHCLKQNTSVHLATRAFGHRDFIDGTIAQLLLGEVEISRAKPRIFSPFGLGVLDLAVGLEVFTTGVATDRALAVPDFFAEVERW
jgi:ornithine cyclodeaminase